MNILASVENKRDPWEITQHNKNPPHTHTYTYKHLLYIHPTPTHTEIYILYILLIITKKEKEHVINSSYYVQRLERKQGTLDRELHT